MVARKLIILTAMTVALCACASRAPGPVMVDDAIVTSAGQTPIRKPRTGSCQCPYDFKRNGASCGGSSAFSRKGGAKPKCYK